MNRKIRNNIYFQPEMQIKRIILSLSLLFLSLSFFYRVDILHFGFILLLITRYYTAVVQNNVF